MQCSFYHVLQKLHAFFNVLHLFQFWALFISLSTAAIYSYFFKCVFILASIWHVYSSKCILTQQCSESSLSITNNFFHNIFIRQRAWSVTFSVFVIASLKENQQINTERNTSVQKVSAFGFSQHVRHFLPHKTVSALSWWDKVTSVI